MSAIPAQEFLDALEKSNERLIMNVVQAIQGIQATPVSAPVVNVPAPVVNVPAPNVFLPVEPTRAPLVNVIQPPVNIDVQGIIQSIENLQDKMITPIMVRTITEQLETLAQVNEAGAINVNKVYQRLGQLIGRVANSTDIEKVVDELLLMNETLQGIQDTLIFDRDKKEPNQLSYFIRDQEFYEYRLLPGTTEYQYVPKSQDQIINTLTERGLISFENEMNRKRLLDMSEEELIQLGAVRGMIQEQAKAIYDYKNNQEQLILKDYRRAGFDMFSKDGDKTKQGTPLSKETKFIYSKIPDVVIKFKNGRYEAFQNGKSISFKNFRDADRFANKGGFLSDELQLLRNIEKTYFKKEEPLQVIFKARKQ